MYSTLMIALVTLMIGTTSFAQELLPDPGSVTINSFTNSGSGCPPGSVAANLSPDNKALTLLFDSYVLDSSETESFLLQKNCVINMSLKAPVGWRYALFSIDYRGFADLEDGVTAEQETEYAFGVSGQKRIGNMVLKGPTSTDYFTRSTGLISELAWSDCGNNGGPDVLQISTKASLDTKPAPAEQTLYLASGGRRYAETKLSDPILAMTLVKKDSASPCSLGKSFGFNGNTAWVNKGCRAQFSVQLDRPVGPKPVGLLTVDSIDAQLHTEAGQQYGVAWQRCGEGQWVQADGKKDCNNVCKHAGLKQGRDPFGAECASGEARPNSAVGSIQFPNGCWGGCQAQGNIKTDATSLFCYQPGQKRDADKTDRIAGCYCTR